MASMATRSRSLSTPRPRPTPVNTETPAAKKRRAQGADDVLDPRCEELIASLASMPPVGRAQRFRLSDAVRHIAVADGRRLEKVVINCGAPTLYSNVEDTEDVDTFRSLCRIVVGQQLAGAAAKTIWARFLTSLGGDASLITPEAVLASDMEALRSSAGLSNAKARSIFDLAAHYERGDLSDAVLLDPSLSAAELYAKLTAVKGIGPWSAHMYQMFGLLQPDIFPTGDLGVRNGIKEAFGLRGAGKNGALDEKRDKEKLEAAMAPFAPYRSLAAWYMWRCADTPSFLE